MTRGERPGAAPLSIDPGVGSIEVAGAIAFGTLAAAVVIGVSLTLLGAFSPIPVAVLAVATGVWMARPVWRAGRPRRLTLPADMAVLVLVIAWIAVNAAFAGQHVFTERDPGVYLDAGWWLTDHGRSQLEFAPGLVEETDGSFSMSGYWDDRGDGALSTQFPDGLPVVLAIAGVAGAGGLFVAPVVLGGLALLAVYLLATRFVGRWWALLAAASLGVNLVHVHFSRDAYTEPMTLALVFGGGWLLIHSMTRPVLAWSAGLVIGSALLVRIDVLLVLAVLPLIAVVGLIGDSPVTVPLRRAGVVIVGLLALGLVHLMEASPLYWSVYDRRLTLVAIALGAASVGVAVVYRWRAPITGFVDRHRRVLADSALVVLGLAVAYLWVLRPLGPADHGPTRPFIGELLGREGSTPDPTRTMAEMTGVWLWWYLGPVLVAGLAGLLTMARRVVIEREPGAAYLTGSVLVMGALYLWRPSINPEQLWAMRRFLPVVLPGLTVLAAWWLASLMPGLRRGRGVFAVVAALIMLSPIVRTAPVADAEPLEGAYGLVLTVCDALPEEAVLFAAGTAADGIWGPPLRVFCDVPVVVTSGPRLQPLLVQARAQGLDPLWFGSGCRPPGAVVVSTAAAFPIVELTVTRPPDDFVDDFYGVEVIRPEPIEPFVCEGDPG